MISVLGFAIFDVSSFGLKPLKITIAVADGGMVSFEGLGVVGGLAFGGDAGGAEAVGVEHAHHATVFQGMAAAVAVGLLEEVVHGYSPGAAMVCRRARSSSAWAVWFDLIW